MTCTHKFLDREAVEKAIYSHYFESGWNPIVDAICKLAIPECDHSKVFFTTKPGVKGEGVVNSIPEQKHECQTDKTCFTAPSLLPQQHDICITCSHCIGCNQCSKPRPGT